MPAIDRAVVIDEPVEIVKGLGAVLGRLGQEGTHIQVIQGIVYVLVNLLLRVIYYFEAFQVYN